MLSALIGALLLGIVAGLRSMTAPAALYLARGGLAGYILGILAIIELLGDLSPKAPPRTFPPGLIARIVSGAFVGWMICAWHAASPFGGALLGLIGALAGAYGGKAVRLWMIERLGAIAAALAEDAVAIALAACVVLLVTPVRLGV